MDNCPMCSEILQALNVTWHTQRYVWESNNALPIREIRRISREIRQALENKIRAGRTQGPDHTAHTQYVPAQMGIMELGAALAEDLADRDREWNDAVANIREENLVDGRVLQAIIIRRHNRRELLTEQSWTNFLTEHQRFMAEINNLYMSAAGITD